MSEAEAIVAPAEEGWIQIPLATLDAISGALSLDIGHNLAKAAIDEACAGGDLTYNRVSQVYFRAGLLACREYMARFVEQGGDAATAASIRANWWPALGDDPGAPRKLDFSEVTDGGDEGPWHHRATPPSVEALPYALGFIGQPSGVTEAAQDAEAAAAMRSAS